tara:strand:+ start:256 stop:453 length:198 start_codon:yes stop_codon:yes gene_type:complete
MKVIRTLICEDGIVGLNGYQYLLDDNNDCLVFDNETKAIDFLISNGVDKESIDNGNIEIVDLTNN